MKSNAIAIAYDVARRAKRTYHSYIPLSALMLRRKFRDLPRELYDELWPAAARNIGGEAARWHGDYHKIRRDHLSTIVSHSQVSLNNVIQDRLLMDKSITQELLLERGYPVPEHLTFDMKDFAKAAAFFNSHDKHVVVKPASGTGGGRGVTTDITDIETVKSAARLATHFSSSALIEQQAQGSSYRLLFLGGKFVDAIRRDPPVITADGKRTIKQLIAAENSRRLNERPISALSPVTIDLDCHLTLSKQGLSLDSRPPAGQEVTLKQAVNNNSAAQNHNVTDQVHSEVIEIGARLVADFGLTLAGIDVQIDDISRPFTASGGLIIEVNSPPGIHHHYLLADPATRYPVAESLLEYMFSNHDGVIREGD